MFSSTSFLVKLEISLSFELLLWRIIGTSLDSFYVVIGATLSSNASCLFFQKCRLQTFVFLSIIDISVITKFVLGPLDKLFASSTNISLTVMIEH